MTALVTIGIPFYNNSSTVLDAVRSVFAQEHADWHLLLVDDGSTDDSVAMLSEVRDPRVSLVVDGQNLGLAARLNQIAQLASSPLLARMDADDLMHPQRLARELQALDESGRDLAVTDAVSIDSHNGPQGYRRSLADPSLRRQFRNSPYIHPTVLGRTAWFRSHPYDPDFRRCQDQELWVRTAGDRTVVTVEEPLLYLRESGTVSAAKYSRSMAGTRQVVRQHGRRMLGRTASHVLLASTWARQGAYVLAERLHRTDALVGSRASSLSPAELMSHASVIETILRTPVPGVDL